MDLRQHARIEGEQALRRPTAPAWAAPFCRKSSRVPVKAGRVQGQTEEGKDRPDPPRARR